MKKVNGSAFDLEARDQETIAVTINGVDCPRNVRMTLDGAPWTGGSFTMSRTTHPAGRQLLVQIDCGTAEPGDRYRILLSGDADSEVSEWTIACRKAPVRTVVYALDVE